MAGGGTSRWMVGRAERSCRTFLAGVLCPWPVETKISVGEMSGAGELLLQSMCPGAAMAG